MTPERWSKVEDLFQVAVARPPNERSGFLEETCVGDDELRREVEALLASDHDEDSMLEDIASGMAAEWAAEGDADDLLGKTLGHYQILSVLGSGGMGEVYLAQDNTLDRKVALKLLPRRFTQDRDRLRFESSEHHHHLRDRGVRWHPLHGHGIRRGRNAARADRRAPA
jgi:serine/threonine protein kinase